MMQVFLPYPDFYQSSSCLDGKRLGNQIYRECKTVVNGGWKYHPVSIIWKDHKYALCEYALIGLKVLRERGRFYPHWVEWFKNKQDEFLDTGLPSIVGNKHFHDSHKSNLLRRDKQFYGKYNWDVLDNLPYVWHVNERK